MPLRRLLSTAQQPGQPACVPSRICEQAFKVAPHWPGDSRFEVRRSRQLEVMGNIRCRLVATVNSLRLEGAIARREPDPVWWTSG